MSQFRISSPGRSQSPTAEPSTSVYDSLGRRSPFFEELEELVRYWDLVQLWTRRNLNLRYKRSVLGVLWTLLEPLMQMTILAIVFSTAFRFPVSKFPIYLLSGLLAFDFFKRSTVQIIDEIAINQDLSQKIHFPRSAFAVAAILTQWTNWLVAMGLLGGLMLIFDQPFTPALLTVPFGMLLTGLFAFGVGLIVATLTAFFRDFSLSYNVLLTAFLYATPIIYPVEIVPERFSFVYELNPMYYLCSVVRSPIHQGVVAPWEHWAIALALSVSLCLLGWWIFTSRRDLIAYRA